MRTIHIQNGARLVLAPARECRDASVGFYLHQKGKPDPVYFSVEAVAAWDLAQAINNISHEALRG